MTHGGSYVCEVVVAKFQYNDLESRNMPNKTNKQTKHTTQLCVGHMYHGIKYENMNMF